MKAAQQWIERERHERAQERALAALGKKLIALGYGRGSIEDFVGDLFDERRRREHATVELDDWTLVDWEIATCFNDEQSRHQLNGRAPRHYYDDRLELPEEEPIGTADVVEDVEADTEAMAA